MQEKILMLGPRKHSSYPLNFFFCMRSPAGVNVDIPLQNFITSFQVVDVYTQCILNNPGGVLKFAVQTTKYLYFIVNKARDCGNPLEPIHTHKLVIVALRYGMVPTRAVEIQRSSGFPTTKHEFNIRDLLRFCPNMASLKIRIELKPLFCLFTFDPFHQAVERIIYSVTTVPGEFWNIGKSCDFHDLTSLQVPHLNEGCLVYNGFIESWLRIPLPLGMGRKQPLRRLSNLNSAQAASNTWLLLRP